MNLILLLTIDSQVVTKSKEFFMSAEEKQRQKDREHEESEKMKDLEK